MWMLLGSLGSIKNVMNLYWVYLLLFLLNDWPPVESGSYVTRRLRVLVAEIKLNLPLTSLFLDVVSLL